MSNLPEREKPEVLIERSIWNQHMQAVVNDYQVEIFITNWSGRQKTNSALDGINDLLSFLNEVKREIISRQRTPGIHLSDITDKPKSRPDTCKHCHRHFIDCNCDLCSLEGHKWSLSYAVQGELFKCCNICGLETSFFSLEGKSWREQIVIEEIIKDDARS